MSSNVPIGNWKQLNSIGCGLTRLSSGLVSGCMKWHNNSLAGLKNARNVTMDEAPFVVLVHKIRLMGSMYNLIIVNLIIANGMK